MIFVAEQLVNAANNNIAVGRGIVSRPLADRTEVAIPVLLNPANLTHHWLIPHVSQERYSRNLYSFPDDNHREAQCLRAISCGDPHILRIAL